MLFVHYRSMRLPLAPLCIALTLVVSGCTDTGPESQPDPFLTAVLTGAITDSLQGTPQISQWNIEIDQYEFQIFAELTKGWYQSIWIWGEGPRPRVGTHPVTLWREGEMGTRMHAMFSRDLPGAPVTYHAVSGELRITASTSRGIVGEFTFHAMRGYMQPDRVELSQDTPIDVRGSFAASCDGLSVCR
jgi:hypothetical protein